MRRQIVGSVRAGESVTRVAERLLDIDNPIVEVPRYARELKEAAQFAKATGDPNLYEKAVDKWRGTIERLGEKGTKPGAYTIRSAGQQLVKDLRKAKPDQIDDIVKRWVMDRARYQARLVARNEAVEAYRDAYQKSTQDKEYVKGYRWVLSGSHVLGCDCEIFANQDLDGLGPGGYAPDAIPSIPHPACLCALVAIIDRKHFRRKLAEARGQKAPAESWKKRTNKTAEDWLKKQPKSKQLHIMGPTRTKALEDGLRVTEKRGKMRPVHEILGQPPPKRSGGLPVRAKPIIRRDRENMVRPFPTVRPAKK